MGSRDSSLERLFSLRPSQFPVTSDLDSPFFKKHLFVTSAQIHITMTCNQLRHTFDRCFYAIAPGELEWIQLVRFKAMILAIEKIVMQLSLRAACLPSRVRSWYVVCVV